MVFFFANCILFRNKFSPQNVRDHFGPRCQGVIPTHIYGVGGKVFSTCIVQYTALKQQALMMAAILFKIIHMMESKQHGFFP